MYNIILDGEVVETVHYNTFKELMDYIQINYKEYGLRPTFKEVKL